MRNFANICKLTLPALLIVLTIGCSKILKDEPTQPEKQQPTETSQPTRFDPLALDDDKVVVPAQYPQPGDVVLGQMDMQVSDIADSLGADTLIAPAPPSAIDTVNSQAFCVQLYTTKVYGDARYQVRVAEEIFDRPIILEYEVPYFKVRVGSFGSRDAADDYLMRAKTAGFTDAWVVAVTVNVQEAAPLYESTGGSELLDSTWVDSLIQEHEGQ